MSDIIASAEITVTDVKDGVGIEGVVTRFLATHLDKGVTTSTGDWSIDPPLMDVVNKYLWSYETITYTDGHKQDGKPAIIGVYGEDGVGIENIFEYYLVSNKSTGILSTDSRFKSTIPTMNETNRYLWKYEEILYTNNERNSTSPVVVGVYGDKGTSIKNIKNYYLATSASSGITRDTDGFKETMQPLSLTNKYLWNYETIEYENPTSFQSTNPVIIGVHGEDGKDGVDAKLLYLSSTLETMSFDANGDASPASQTATIEAKLQNTSGSISFVAKAYNGTSALSNSIALGGTGNSRTLSVSSFPSNATHVSITATLGSLTDTISIFKLRHGKEGVGGAPGQNAIVGYLTNESITLGANSSGRVGSFTPATGTFRMFDGTTEVTTSTSYTLENSNGLVASINSSTGVYSITAMSADTATAEFKATYKGVSIFKTVTLSKSIAGEKGDTGDTGPKGATGSQGPRGNTGTSVESVTEYYLATSASSGIVATDTRFTTAIQTMTPTNKYLWNYEKINFSDNTSQPTIPVIIGVYGDKGQTGSTGATGRSITSITEHYLVTSASSGVTRSTSGWGTAMKPTTETNRYLWNYETVNWSSGTTPTYVEPIIIGVHGARGPQGAQGPQGATGSQGPRGNTGTSVVSITEYYLATSVSSGIQSSNAGFTTAMQPLTATNKYLWNYEKVNFSDNTSQPTIPVVIGVYGDKGQTGSTGATGRSITSITEHYLATSASTGVTRTTSGWSTAMKPTTETNKYLWNYETINWSSGTTPTYVEPIIIGVHGAKGNTGATGKDAISAVLTNESITFAANSSGAVQNYVGNTGNFLLMEGAINRSSLASVTYSKVSETNVSATITSNGAYTISSMTGGTNVTAGQVTFRVTYNGTTIDKTISISKSIAGQAGSPGAKGDPGAPGSTGAPGAAGSHATSYWITSSVDTITMKYDGDYDPKVITFYGHSKTGTSNATTYAGRFIIQTSTNGTSYTQAYISSSNQSSYAFTIPSNVSFVKAKFYQAGGTTYLLDEQTVPVLQSAENLEFGGRNLVLGTAMNELWSTWSNVITNELTDDGSKITWNKGSASQSAMQSPITGSLITGEKYVATLEVKGTLNNLQLFIITKGSPNYNFYSSKSDINANSFTKLTIPFTYTPSLESDTFFIGGTPSAIGQWLEVKKETVQIEKGNVATDWTEAPEDAELRSNKKTYNPVRYIRDWSGGSSANTGNHKYELQAYVNGENIARGKTVTGNGPTNSGLQVLTNGSTSTGSYLNLGNSSTPVYAQVDLGEVYYNVDSIAIWRYYNDNRTYHNTKIEVSADGTNWVPVFDSLIEGEYPESADGRSYPNTKAKSESLVSSTETINRLGDSTSRTIINGRNITTGRVQSKNSLSWLDLDTGHFNFGNGGLVYSGGTLALKGTLSVSDLTGTIPKSKLDSTLQTEVTAGANANTVVSANKSTWDTVTSKATPAQAQGYASTAETNAKNYAELKDSVTSMNGNAKKFANTASYDPGGSSYTGYLIIRTPITSAFMTKLKISGFNYRGGSTNLDLDVGFYAYTSTSFANHDFVSRGSFPISQVRLGRDSAGRAVVILGTTSTTYSYPKISVDEAIIGHGKPPDSYKDGWSISISTSLSGISNVVSVSGVDTQSNLSNAKAKTDAWSYNGTTEIDGKSIKTGTLEANQITTGTLSAQSGNSWLNLNNGEFNFANGGLVYSGGNLTLNGKLSVTNLDGAIPKSRLDSTTQTQINAGNTAKSTLDSKASGWDAKETTTGAQQKATAAETAAKKYVDDNTGNLVNNPAATGNHTGWSASGLSSLNQTFEGVSARVLQSSIGSDTQNYSSYFKVDPSKAYEVSAWFKKSIANASGYYFGLNGINASGSTVGFVQTSQTGAVSNANNTNFYFTSGTGPTDWVKIVGYIMPVGTTPSDLNGVGTASNAIMKQNIDRIRLRFLNWSNAGTVRQLWVANPKVVEVDPNAVIYGASAKTKTDVWSYNGTTEIDGKSIRTGTLEANKITTGTMHGNRITAGTIAANRIVANSIGAGQIAANAITASELSASAITAGHIGAGVISADKITSGTIDATKLSIIAGGGTVIDKDGVTVKDGSFFLEDSKSSSKYSLEIKNNLIQDHSFESVQSYSVGGVDLARRTKNMAKPNDTVISYAWHREGNPFISISGTNESGEPVGIFGRSILVNNSNKVFTLLSSSTTQLGPRARLTLSFHFKNPKINATPGGGIPKVIVTIQNPAGETNYQMVYNTYVLSDDVKRETVSFSMPSHYDPNYHLLKIELSSANDKYVMFDGLQLVLGDNAVQYQTDTESWSLRTELGMNSPNLRGDTGYSGISPGLIHTHQITVPNQVDGRVVSFMHSDGMTTQMWADEATVSGRLDVYQNVTIGGNVSIGGDITGNFEASKNTGKTYSTINATNNHSNRWNSSSNSSLKLRNNNNALSFIVGGTQNNRHSIIQGGHSDAQYASALSHLYINKFGGTTYIGSGLSVSGTKNAIHPTRDGMRATPAYEMAESYLGDMGEDKTGLNSKIKIMIDTLFFDTVNTDYTYHVFLQAHSNNNVWVEEREKNYFVIASDSPGVSFSWEMKAKRRGFEKDRLVRDDNITHEDLQNMQEFRGTREESEEVKS